MTARFAQILAVLALFLPGVAVAADNLLYFSTKLNVSNIEKSIDFYTNMMGLKVATQTSGGRVLEVILTKGGEKTAVTEQAIVLAYNKERKEPLVIGDAFNNITFVVSDLAGLVKKLEVAGHKITGNPAPRPSATPAAKQIAVVFLKDPDGYTIELLQRFQ